MRDGKDIAREVKLRPAAPDDADVLAELVNYAGEGIPLLVWSRMAKPGESAFEVGRQRARRESGAFSYRNAIVAETGGRAVAALVDYRLPDPPEPVPDDSPALFRPLGELEALAPGSWYVNVLAVVPEKRGRGLGKRLLAEAERRAEAAGATELSIIVSNANERALGLYHAVGYRRRAERPMVKDGWENAGTAWLLLTKPLAPAGQ